MKTYRVDYMPADAAMNADPVVIYGLDRSAAMLKARKLSRTHGSAYAIARKGDQDIGQKVYANGAFSYQDGDF